MKNRVLLLVALTMVLLLTLPFGAEAAELGRPTVYADGWAGFYATGPEGGEAQENSLGAGLAAGAYFDLGRRQAGVLRFTFLEASDLETFDRLYSVLDILLGWRIGSFRVLVGPSVLDRRDFEGTTWGGWGWRVGVTGERVVGRLLAGGGVYATPDFPLRRSTGGIETVTQARNLEGEVYLVLPLGKAWAIRGGCRGFQLGAQEPGHRHLEEGVGLFAGLTARF